MATTPQVIVNVKSAWASKINWIAGATAALATLNDLLPIVPPAYQHYVTAAIAIIGGVLLIYTKTFQSASITPSSLPKVPSVTTEEAQTAKLNNNQIKGAA